MAPAISSPRERSPRRAQHLRFERSIGSSWRGIPIQKSFLRFWDARVSSRHNNCYRGINTWTGWQPTASNDGTRRFVRLTSHLGRYPTTGRQWLSSSASKALKQIHHPGIGTGRGTSTNSCRGGSLWGQCRLRVDQRKTQCEQMSSELPLKADIAQYSRHVSNVPTPEVTRLIRSPRRHVHAGIANNYL